MTAMRNTAFLLLFLLIISIFAETALSGGGAATEDVATVSNSGYHPPGAFVAVNGAKVWYESEGSGEPLILIPGGPGFSHSYFHPYFHQLSKSFRVIYYDPFGRGKSDRATESRNYKFSHDVEEIEGLRRALGLGRINLLGHSYGGMAALAFALRYPLSVQKLVLADSLFSAEMWQANNDNWNYQIRNQFPEVWEKLTALRKRGVHSCNKEYQDIEYEVPLGLWYFYNGSAAEQLSRTLEPQSLDVYCSIAGDDADFLIGGDIAKLDFRSKLANLRMPVLILAGRFDRLAFPRFSLQFKRYAPRAQFVMFEKSGHLPFIEEPDRMFGVVSEFLQK